MAEATAAAEAQAPPGPFPERAKPELPSGYEDKPQGVLLDYQKRDLELLASTALVVIEKSRRIGVTWAVAARAVLLSARARSAGGMDTLYIGYNLDMAREFIDTCGMWARAFNQAASSVQEFMFDDSNDDEPDRFIKAFRITFASGYEIIALSSKPRSLRGRQGFVIIDEAAFHDDLEELLKAALALLVWGGSVCVISTHDGADNPFNELVNEIRAGKRKGVVSRTDFDEALADGLYKRVCLVTGKEWSPEAEAEWRQSIIDAYGNAADEELFCIPRRGGRQPLTGALIEACMVDVPVLRWECDDDFALREEGVRVREAKDWCEAKLLPLLRELPPELPSYFGEDFGRFSDLSCIWPVQLSQTMRRQTPFTVELRNVPFEQQRQVLFYVVDLLPRFSGGALDAGGNGGYLAEVAWQRYGEELIQKVALSESWYRDNMPPFVAEIEERNFDVPRDRDVGDDLKALREINGVVRVPPVRKKGSDGLMRHGDAAIAGALAEFATRMEVREYGYVPATIPGSTGIRDEGRMRMRPDTSEDLGGTGGGARWNKGAW